MPQITRINSRSGYQQIQINSARTKQGVNTLDVARALSTNAGSVTYRSVEDQQHVSMDRGPLPRRRMVQGRLQDNIQIELRKLDDMVQKTGRLTEKKLMSVFDKLCKADSVTPNQALLLIRSCGSLLVELPYHRRNELVTKVWDKLAEQGLRYDVTHYNALLWVYLENEYKFSPTDFLAQMENKGIEPNRVTYQRLINAFCRQGDIKGATLILEVLKSKDLPVTEGVFNSLIMGNARAGNMEDAKNMLTVMREMGLDPSLDTFTSLACAYAEKGDEANINETIKEAEANGFTVTPAFYFKIVNSLTANGHSQLVAQFLDQVNLTGFIPDAINVCLSLWTQGYYDESFAVLKTFTTVDTENRTTFFITHMMNSEGRPSSDVLLNYLSQMQELNLHKDPYTMALSHSLQMTNADESLELSLILMNKMKEQGTPIRVHYFWPLLVAQSKRQNSQGVARVIRAIDDAGLKVDVLTLKDYVFPSLKGKGSLLEKLKEIGVDDEIACIALCSNHLVGGQRNAPGEVLTMFENNPRLAGYRILNNDIARYFARAEKPNTRDLAKLLQFVSKQSKEVPVQDAEQAAEETEAVDGMEEPAEQKAESVLGGLLYLIVNEVDPSQAIFKVPALRDLFRTLKNQGVQVPLSYLRGIRRVCHAKLNLRALNDVVEDLANKDEVMQDPFLNADFLSGKEGEDIAQVLESKYREDTDAKPKQVLIKLLELYAQQNNVEKVNELLQEYDDRGFDRNLQLLQSLIQMHCRCGNLEEALKIKETVRSTSLTPSDAQFYTDLAVLMVEKNQLEDVANLLEDFTQNVDTNKYTYFVSETVEKILTRTAEMGLAQETTDLFDKCLENGIIKPEKSLLQPLVNAHLKKDDLKGAVRAVAKIKNMYDIYPSDQDLLVKLIGSGDKALQKEVLRNMNESVGEVNMIYSLTFAFLENKKYEEAEKLMKAPGIDARMERLRWFAERCIANNLGETLEKLVDVTDHLYGIDTDAMQYYLIKFYAERENNPDKCMEVYNRMQDNDIIPSRRTLRYLSDVLEEHGKSVPFEIPEWEPARARPQRQEREERTSTGPNLRRDPSLSAPKQVQAYLKQFEGREYPDKFYTAVRAQVLETAASGDLEAFSQVKEGCQQIPGYTDSDDFLQLELRAHVESSNLEGAKPIFESLLSRNQEPYRVTFFQFVRSMAKEGMADELLSIKANYEEKFDKQFRFTGQILAAIATKNGTPAALQWARDQISQGAKSTELGLVFFFSKLLEENKLDETVTDFVDSLLQKDDMYPAKNLVQAYVLCDRFEEARQLLQKNDALKGTMLSLAAKMSNERQKVINVEKLYEVLKISEIDGSDRGVIYSHILKGYAKRGDWEGALRLRQEMAAENLTMSELDLKRLALLLKKHGQEVPFQEPPEKFQFYLQQLKNKKTQEIASAEEMS